MSESINLLSGLKSAVSENYGSTGTCPDNSKGDAFGLAILSEIKGRYVDKVETGAGAVAHSCQLKATFGTKDVSDKIRGKNVVLIMKYATGIEKWSCSSNLDNKYLPSACRSY